MDTAVEASSASSAPRESPRHRALVLGICGAVLTGVTMLAWPFIAPALRRHCLPYIPATEAQVRNVVTALQLPAGATGPRKFVDLGSGAGHIVLGAGACGLAGVGYELNPWLVLFSTMHSKALGLGRVSKFAVRDLWKVNMGEFDDVVIFGVAEMMGDLRGKLSTELKPTGRVVACRFPLPNTTPAHTIGDGIDTVWVYSASSVKKNLN